MHIWSALAAREVALLVVLLLLGSGPAAFLSPRFDAAMRIALAPLLGFCLGTCLTSTILWFAPVNDTYWVLIPLAVGSAAAATVRTWRAGDRRPWRTRLRVRDVVALVVVGLAVTGPVNLILRQHHTVGPAVFTYTDVANYVAVQDAARTTSLEAANDAWSASRHTGARFANQSQLTWAFFAQFGSNLDATPLDANVNALLGLGATDTFAPFLSVLLLMGALGAFAGVRYLSGERTWLAALAGCLFGGPLFLELWFDSYQAAIIAVGVLVPFLVLVTETIRGRRRADIALVALVFATMLTIYPLYMAFLVAVAVLMIGWRGRTIRRSGEPLRPLLAPLVRSVVAIAVIALVLDPVAVARDAHYYYLVLQNKVPFPRVGYHLPVSDLPGWIAQTREFWALSGLGSGVKQILLGIVLPLVFVLVALVGLRRFRNLFSLVAFGAVCAAAAEYAYVSQQQCTYCAERNLLPLAPIAAVLLTIGLLVLLSSQRPAVKLAGIVGVLLVIVPVAQRTRVELTRFSHDSYFLDTSNRSLLARLQPHAAVLVEGYNSSVIGQAEQPLIYHLVNERTGGHALIVLGSNVNNALAYVDFAAVLPPGPEFDPAYRYVLTRLGSVATDRHVIARSGGIALEERVKPLDLTPYGGLGTALERIARDGIAWVQTQYPLQLYLTGPGRERAWARLSFIASGRVMIPPQAGVRARQVGNQLTVCAPATGAAPVRRVSVQMIASLFPGPAPHEVFPPAMPLEGLALTAMHAVSGKCIP